MTDDGPFPFFQGRSSSSPSLYTSLVHAVGVVFLALCPQVESQAPQHFTASETQAACDGVFACRSVCSVMSVVTLACPGQYELHPQSEGVGLWGVGIAQWLECRIRDQ